MPRYPKIKAHEKHKLQVQAAFDFAVTTCYAIPQLENHLAQVEASKTVLQKPIYFAGQNTTPYLREGIKNFESRLAAHIYLSLFSFFEAFIKDSVQELFVEEVPGVNAQEKTKEELLSSLKEILGEALEFNRAEARHAAGRHANGA